MKSTFDMTFPDPARQMRHNQRFDYEGLREEANEIFRASGKSQTQLADELGKSQAVISRALNEENSTLGKTLREIIAHLTAYEIEEEISVSYRAIRRN